MNRYAYNDLHKRSYDAFSDEYFAISYIDFLEECDEIAIYSARKPSLSDYDAIVIPFECHSRTRSF